MHPLLVDDLSCSAFANGTDIDNIPPEELSALSNLYTATNGQNWDFGKNPGNVWNFTAGANPCLDFWEGLRCSSSPHDGYLHIQSVSLSSYNLWGSLPDSIANLTYVVNLTLSDNLFTGHTIPASIGTMSRLQVLDLGSGYFEGTLPDSISNLSELEWLDLSTNRLTEPFPESICFVQRVQHLNLYDGLFYGPIPECLYDLTELAFLSLGRNAFNGTISSRIGQLTKLSILAAEVNFLNGTLPDSFANLHSLHRVDLSKNLLSGTLPSFLGNMVSLSVLCLTANIFSGSIPESFGNLGSLTELFLNRNLLTGTIPNSLTQLTGVVRLNLEVNRLTGTLPTGLSNLQVVEILDVENNQLSGTIPASLGQILQLNSLGLQDNDFTGSLPNIFAALSHLISVVVNANALTGTVPHSLLNLPQIRFIDISSNKFTGQLQWGEAESALYFLNCAYNHFTGPFPSLLRRDSATALAYLNITDNAFTGPLPVEITDLGLLNFFYISNNYFYDALPDVWDAFPYLSFLYMDSNLFSDPIPDSLTSARNMQSLNLSNNMLSGTITKNFSQLGDLNVLLLENNRLTGNIHHLFNVTGQRISIVQVSNNQLTGTLPDSLGYLKKLQVFAAVSNCFSGAIPVSLCNSSSLNTLALDGLQSATSCQRKLFPAALEDSVVAQGLYSIRSPVSGGVPGCLFSMVNLTTLHLSGNGLTGPIRIEGDISATLTDLSLSHNDLTGTIPASILQRDWTNLDLSYNCLDGSLQAPSGYANSTSIYLDNNRISGRVPHAYTQLSSVSILESNLFACKDDRSDLPASDPDVDQYDCGSSVLDDAVYAWVAVVSVVVGALVYLWYSRSSASGAGVVSPAVLLEWWKVGEEGSEGAGLPHFRRVEATVWVVVRTALVGAVYAVVVLVPLYAVCSALYGTYSHQYAWSISAAYLSGTVPFAWEMVFLLLLVPCCAAAALYFSWAVRSPQREEPEKDTGEPKLRRSTFHYARKQLVYCAVVVTNFAIVTAVNTGYVIIALNENGDALTLAQIALALFKVAYNSACSPLLMRWACQRFLGRQPSAASYVTLQLFVSVVNNIVVPCLVVSIISPNCFNDIFTGLKEVSASFEYAGQCDKVFSVGVQTFHCADEAVLTAQTTYSPPFAYSYQCSSSFITYYSPAFVIMCMFGGFGIPLAQAVLQRLHERAEKGSRWRAVGALVPRILKPVGEEGGEMSDAAHAEGARTLTERNVFQPLFDASQHVITLLTYLALLLTFGAVFPPLAVCFAVTVASMAAFTRLKVGRFVVAARVQGVSGSESGSGSGSGLVSVLEQECEGVGSGIVLRRAASMLVILSCSFYTLFLFDTLGDNWGVSAAYWVLIVVPLLGVCVLLGTRLYIGFTTQAKTREVVAEATASPISQEVELRISSFGGASSVSSVP